VVFTRLKSFDDIAVVVCELKSCVGSCLSCRDPHTRVLLKDLSLGEQRRQLRVQISRNRDAPSLGCNFTAPEPTSAKVNRGMQHYNQVLRTDNATQTEQTQNTIIIIHTYYYILHIHIIIYYYHNTYYYNLLASVPSTAGCIQRKASGLLETHEHMD